MAFAILKSSMPFEPDIGLGLTNSNRPSNGNAAFPAKSKGIENVATIRF
jgi:hypothetical protein